MCGNEATSEWHARSLFLPSTQTHTNSQTCAQIKQFRAWNSELYLYVNNKSILFSNGVNARNPVPWYLQGLGRESTRMTRLRW